MAWQEYTWLIVLHGIVAWINAFGTGANDLANAFASSVGSKTLKLWLAVGIASVLELVGAMALGGNVTRTVAASIARTSSFQGFPAILMWGMICAEAGSCSWLLLATYLELPVSSTHAIVGGIVGFSLVWGGGSAVNWYSRTHYFPYMTGVVPVAIAWVVAPLAAGLACWGLFLLLRAALLRRAYSLRIAFLALPLFLWMAVFVGVLLILVQVPSINLPGGAGTAAAIAAGAGVAAALAGAGILLPRLVRQLNCMSGNEAVKQSPAAATTSCPSAPSNACSTPCSGSRPPPSPKGMCVGLPADCVLPVTAVDAWGDVEEDAWQAQVDAALKRWSSSDNTEVLPTGCCWGLGDLLNRMGLTWVRRRLAAALAADLHGRLAQESAAVIGLHEGAERFDPRTEQVFKMLQVLSACAMSFAHGANDVANSVGTFAASYYIYTTLQLPGPGLSISLWMLAIGASGIIMGLALYGFNIMVVLGLRSTHISPSRGFCMETSAAAVVAAGSAMGLPLSTTQTICGSAIGLSQRLASGPGAVETATVALAHGQREVVDLLMQHCKC